MKKLIIAVIVTASILGMNACKKFDAINTNPNAPTTVTPSLLATNLILNIMRPDWDKGYMYSFLTSKYINLCEYAEDLQYNKFGTTDFSGMTELTNVNKMINLAADVDKESYTGLGLFIKAYKQYYYSIAVGDIPYSEAMKGEEGNTKPKYDTQKDVMLQILQDLDKADKAFEKGKNFSGDPIFKGDVLQWRKTVNAFRLKVLIGLSRKEADTDLKIKETFAHIVNNLPKYESSSDNLQLVFSSKANQIYPFNTNVSRYTSYAIMSSVLVDTLKKFGDYRLFYYANPSKDKIETEGKSPSDWDAYPGIDPSMDFSIISDLYTTNKHSKCNSRYTGYEPGEPLIRIGYVEQCFNIAEAIIRGWVGGDAKGYYEKGITEAMNFIITNTPDIETYNHGRKMDAGYILNYLQAPYVKFSSTTQLQLKQIWQQKYIYYFMQHPWDAYYECRRTNYPVMPINQATTKNVDDKNNMPLRWMYPSSERSYNAENLKAALDRQYGGQDLTNGVMWILK